MMTRKSLARASVISALALLIGCPAVPPPDNNGNANENGGEEFNALLKIILASTSDTTEPTSVDALELQADDSFATFPDVLDGSVAVDEPGDAPPVD